MWFTNYLCPFVHPQQNKGIESQKAWGQLDAILSILLAQPGSPRAGCPGLNLDDFEYLYEWKPCNHPGQPLPVLSYTLSQLKIYFLMFRGNLLYFDLCPLPCVLCLGTTEKVPAEFENTALHPPLSYLYTLVRSPLYLFFAKLKSRFFGSMFESKAECMPLNKPKLRKGVWPLHYNHTHCLSVNMVHGFLMAY